MLDLNDLYLFAEVVQRNGFTAAADSLGIPKSRVSRRISKLESEMGVRLLQRSSRTFNLTDAGRSLFHHCQEMIACAIAGEHAAHSYQKEVSGWIRVSMPVELSDSILVDLLSLFMIQHPKIKVAAHVSNRLVNLVEERFDIVIRGVGYALESSSLIQTNLYSANWGFFASPTYIEKFGLIDTLDKFSEVDMLLYAPITESPKNLRLLSQNGNSISVPIKLKMQSDNISAIKKATLAGLGVSGLPLYSSENEISNGKLIRILPDFTPKTGQLVILYPSRNGQTPAIRAMIDFFKAELPQRLGNRLAT